MTQLNTQAITHRLDKLIAERDEWKDIARQLALGLSTYNILIKDEVARRALARYEKVILKEQLKWGNRCMRFQITGRAIIGRRGKRAARSDVVKQA